MIVCPNIRTLVQSVNREIGKNAHKLKDTWVLFASSVQDCAASLLETKARLEFDARDCRRLSLNLSMATLEKSDIDQCASRRDCTLEANSTQVCANQCLENVALRSFRDLLTVPRAIAARPSHKSAACLRAVL